MQHCLLTICQKYVTLQVREIQCDGVGWIHLSQDRVKQLGVVISIPKMEVLCIL